MRLPEYPAYINSVVEWLGMIPVHWKIIPLRHIATFNMGQSPDSDYVNQDGEGLPFIQGNAEFGDLYPVEKNYCTEPKKICRKNDLLISVRAPVGEINLANKEFVIGRGLASVTPNSLIDRDFLWHAMQIHRKQLSVMETGTTFKAVSGDDLKNIIFALPNLQEQQAIANFLDRETSRIDKLIAEKQTFIKLLKEKRQALISHVVTKGLNPNVKMKDSGIEWIGEVPEHWEIKRLKYVGRIQSGIAKGKDVADKDTIEVPMLRVANVQDGYLDLKVVHTIQIEPHELNRYSLQFGDVLMNEGGDNDKLGRGAVWRSEVSPCIHQNHVFALRMNKIEPEWLELITQSSYAKFYFYYQSKQSTNLASISSTNIKQTPLIIPPSNERMAFLNYLSSELSRSQDLYNEVLSSIELLKEHRTALISAAVTGKIDVRHFKEEAA